MVLDRRIPADFVSGNINTTPSVARGVEFLNVLESKVMASPYTSSDGPWWSVYHTIATGTGYDKVWKSNGNPDYSSGSVQGGDTRIYVRLSCSTAGAFQIIGYTDYAVNPALGINQNSTSEAISTNTTDDVRFVVWANQYEIFSLIEQDSISKFFIYFGQPIRSHLQEKCQLRCFTTQVASAGSNVTVTVDRDVSSLPTGSYISIIAMTPSGSPASSYTYDTTIITARTTNSITFSNLNNSYSASALVGLDPIPTFASADTVVSAPPIFCNMINQIYRGINANSHAYGIDTGTPETYFDPSEFTNNYSDGYQGYRAIFYSTVLNSAGSRGSSGILTAWSVPASGIQSAHDRFRSNYDNGKIFYPLSGTIGSVSGFIFCIPLVSGSNI